MLYVCVVFRVVKLSEKDESWKEKQAEEGSFSCIHLRSSSKSCFTIALALRIKKVHMLTMFY